VRTDDGDVVYQDNSWVLNVLSEIKTYNKFPDDVIVDPPPKEYLADKDEGDIILKCRDGVVLNNKTSTGYNVHISHFEHNGDEFYSMSFPQHKLGEINVETSDGKIATLRIRSGNVHSRFNLTTNIQEYIDMQFSAPKSFTPLFSPVPMQIEDNEFGGGDVPSSNEEFIDNYSEMLMRYLEFLKSRKTIKSIVVNNVEYKNVESTLDIFVMIWQSILGYSRNGVYVPEEITKHINNDNGSVHVIVNFDPNTTVYMGQTFSNKVEFDLERNIYGNFEPFFQNLVTEISTTNDDHVIPFVVNISKNTMYMEGAEFTFRNITYNIRLKDKLYPGKRYKDHFKYMDRFLDYISVRSMQIIGEGVHLTDEDGQIPKGTFKQFLGLLFSSKGDKITIEEGFFPKPGEYTLYLAVGDGTIMGNIKNGKVENVEYTLVSIGDSTTDFSINYKHGTDKYITSITIYDTYNPEPNSNIAVANISLFDLAFTDEDGKEYKLRPIIYSATVPEVAYNLGVEPTPNKIKNNTQQVKKVEKTRSRSKPQKKMSDIITDYNNLNIYGNMTENQLRELGEYINYHNAFQTKEEHYEDTRELLLKIVADQYTKFPKRVFKVNQQFSKERLPQPFNYNEFKVYLRSECHNLTGPYTKVTMIPDPDKKNVLWCFTDQDMEHIKTYGVNPYTGRPFRLQGNEGVYKEIPRETGFNPSNFKTEVSNESLSFLEFWKREVFSLGNVYFKIPRHIQLDLAKTRPMKSIKLYRGMSFKNRDLYISFLRKIKCKNRAFNTPDRVDDVECELDFDTFSSWTHSREMAYNFAFRYYYNYGVVLERVFQPEEILADLTKINKFMTVEEEVIVLPNRYKNIVMTYVPNADEERILPQNF
jgi:hypothetical protein